MFVRRLHVIHGIYLKLLFSCVACRNTGDFGMREEVKAREADDEEGERESKGREIVR